VGRLALFFTFFSFFLGPIFLRAQESEVYDNLPPTTSTTPTDWRSELESIDRQLPELRDMQEQLRSSIAKKSNNAMRWQFQNENYLDARRAWDQVAREKEQMAAVQKKIDELETRQQELLREHP